MSITLVKAVRDLRLSSGTPKLLPTARYVLMVLATYCNELDGKRKAFVSINTIAAGTTLNRSTVMRAIDDLVEQGFVAADRRHRFRTTYTLTHPEMWLAGGAVPPDVKDVSDASGSAVPPDKAGDWSHQDPKLVAPCDLSGGTVRLQQGFKESEQEVGAERNRGIGTSAATSAKLLGDRRPPKIKPAKGWNRTDQGIEEMAKYLGKPARPGESWQGLEKRLWQEIAQRVREESQAVKI